MKSITFIESPGQTQPARASGRTIPKSPIGRLGQRLVSSASAWILGAVLCGGLAVQSAHGQVIFTRTTANGEGWANYSATFTPTASGNYTLGFNITATDGAIVYQGSSHDDHSIYLDDVRVTGSGVSFLDGFESPVVSAQQVYPNGTFGQWVFGNYSGMIPGSPSQWGSVGPYDGNQRGFVQAYQGTLSSIRTANTFSLSAGQTYTVTFWQASRSGPVGNEGVLTYTAAFNYVPPAPINWVNWTGSETVGGVMQYVGQIVVPRTGGGSTTVNVKYTPPNTTPGGNGYLGIWNIQTSGGIDYWAQGNAGSLGRNPARSPYTSSKVPNIPDGGGATSDQHDIIELRFAGNNTLEFTDASTGLPVSIASPIFAYVSLNGNGYGFDQDFDILSFGDGVVRDQGYFGVGTSFKSVATVNAATQYQLLGTGEPHGALQFRGSFSTVTWQSLSDEIWNGFTIGVAQLAADVPIANAGPDQTVTATSSSGASVQLAGSVSGSTKAPFTFTWSGDFGTASGQNPTVTLPVGTHTITLTVTDAANASDTDEVVVTVLADNVAPVLSLPGTITVEATSPAGAVVTFSATANDAVNGPVPVTLSPPSGSTFPLGIGTVQATATDSSGNKASGMFSVIVQDTTAPTINTPANITAEATGPSGAAVTFAASATDLVDGNVAVNASPVSGSTFPLGPTTVTLIAADARGNTAHSSFTVTVQDTTPPVIATPAPITVEATGPSGAAVSFTATANDIVSGAVSVTASPASGSTFALGVTTVNLSATDAAGNTAHTSFTVTVRDTTPPVIATPANIPAEATGPSGAAVSFTATANDIVSGAVSVTANPASGSTFALGITTVNLSATDAAGNTAHSSFSVTVRDTTPPVIATPANITAEATSPFGAIVTFTASATDLVDGNVAVNASPASGSTFQLGTTTVTLTATDAHGNTATSSFTVTVRDTTPPVIASVTPSTATLWPPNHKLVPITLNVSATDAVGVTSLRIVSVTSNEPDNGLGDGDTANDIVFTTNPVTVNGTAVTGDLALSLRAERSGKGNGRTYTIVVQASDATGNASTKTVTVSVPKSQGESNDKHDNHNKPEADRAD
ncbi:MAG: beta strand repeat-containing protein [Limisphaerales bacterium]